MPSDLDFSQFKINYVCSCLLFCKIRTSQDLREKIDYLFAQINQNTQIFESTNTIEQHYSLLKQALKVYSKVDACSIDITKKQFKEAFHRAQSSQNQYKLTPVEMRDDLSRVTQSYDTLSTGIRKEKTISGDILAILRDKEFTECSQVIFGAGDTGTTLWLEKYKHHHGTIEKELKQGRIPPIVMIADDSGSWKHDYTLAQPVSILERTTAKANPVDYMSTEYYLKNPYANGRHIYQANQVSLNKTGAPLLQAKVLRIEKKSNHRSDWKASSDYRLILSTTHGEKTIYTNEIDICTGLGPAKKAIVGSLIGEKQFNDLNQFDKSKQFTPIVDGNQFILTNSEEQSSTPRTIVIYGGGGTAAACYRKGFFGHDTRTESRPFSDRDQKNKVIWIAKQFEKAGTGKLVTNALTVAKKRNELFQAELLELKPQPDGKFLLLLKTLDSIPVEMQLECDQFIYSIGQDDHVMRNICAEIETDLDLKFDQNMVLNVSSSDGKVTFFGAAAMAVREKAYMEATWQWLREENIGGDVGPGSMPPSRAQIKRYNFLRGIPPESINANMDSRYLIKDYLVGVGLQPHAAWAFVNDLLVARKHSTAGCTLKILEDLLTKHKLRDFVEIQGHGQLVRKTSVESAQVVRSAKTSSLLSWLNPQRKTNDANIMISSVETNKDSQPKTTAGEVPALVMAPKSQM